MNNDQVQVADIAVEPSQEQVCEARSRASSQFFFED